MAIFFTSDLHFGHDKDFIWKARGFSSVEEMNEVIVERFNSVVTPQDEVYILGDIIMGDSDKTIKYLDRLNGYITIICGNHDNARRRALYEEHGFEVVDGLYLTCRKFTFFLSHFPSLTDNYDSGKSLTHRIYNLCGHTHSKEYWEPCGSYNVGVDAHNCYPVSIDTLIERIKKKYVAIN